MMRVTRKFVEVRSICSPPCGNAAAGRCYSKRRATPRQSLNSLAALAAVAA
jgi:hypothetical protein